MPARIPRTTKELQPLAVAIPQAVVGPPTLAFEAISSNFFSRPSSRPTPRITAIWIEANAKMLGVVLITLQILPLAPITTKKTYYSIATGQLTKLIKNYA